MISLSSSRRFAVAGAGRLRQSLKLDRFTSSHRHIFTIDGASAFFEALLSAYSASMNSNLSLIDDPWRRRVAGRGFTARLSQNRLRGIPRNRLYVRRPVMLRARSARRVFPAESDFGWWGAQHNRDCSVEASRIVLFDPIGGNDGQEGVGPRGVGAVGAVRGGVRVVAGLAGVFARCGGGQAVSVRSAQPLA